MKTLHLSSALIFLLVPAQLWADDGPPPNSELALSEAFDGDKLSDEWSVNAGQWDIVDGVLRVKELLSDKHAAAARYKLQSQNAVYQLRFRFVDQGKAFHLGFDPAPGELDKKGHLFSVVITPDAWKILQHADKNKPQERPNKVLAQAESQFLAGTWYHLRVTTWQNYVTARIDGNQELKASDETFAVKKPTLVFRCQGDGVEVDDIKVWRQAQ